MPHDCLNHMFTNLKTTSHWRFMLTVEANCYSRTPPPPPPLSFLSSLITQGPGSNSSCWQGLLLSFAAYLRLHISCMCAAGDESVALGQHDLAAAAGMPSQMHLHGLAAGLVSHDDSASLSETLDHNVEVAAVQNSLANMSMPQPRQESPAPESRLRSPQGDITCLTASHSLSSGVHGLHAQRCLLGWSTQSQCPS